MKIHKTLRNRNIQRLVIVEKLINERISNPTKIVKGKTHKVLKTKETKQKWSWTSDTLPDDPIQDDSLYDYTLVELKQEKERLLNEIIEYRNVSIKMNKIFDEQIKRHVQRSHKTCKCSSCCSYFCLKT